MAKPFSEIFESFSSVMSLLRDKNFQDLLINYERRKKTFIVGYDVVDEVESEIVFVRDESVLKPEDYLLAFSKFIKENENTIDAISILLNRPKSWSTKALTELKKKLYENSFVEINLRQAHKVVYHKEVVDIISMVKHAANNKEPLLSPDERVSQAIDKILKGKKLNEEQLKWMGYIQEHLKQNLTLDEFDLAELPVFIDRGGLKKFKKVFPQDYEKIISEINLAVAA